MIKTLKKIFQLIKSKNINIDNLKTACFILGPYRNLTTYTASICFLHPNFQVLNHAGNLILKDKKLNFLLDYNDKKFQRFLKYAIYISQRTNKDGDGGSITSSHSFDPKYKVKDIFQKTFGNMLLKNDKLKFILPIRNPLDCVISNINTEQIYYFNNLKSFSKEEILNSILDIHLWFYELWTKYPERFFYYFEYDLDESLLKRFANFMSIEPFKDWISNSLEAFGNKSKYEHEEEFISYYKTCVNEKFEKYPEFKNNLLKFTEIPINS